MGFLWTALKGILSSKKGVAALAAVLFALVSPLLRKVGFEVTLDQTMYVVGALVAYVLGQGLADIGKEAKALETKKK
jgi:hypothetical protein